MFSDVLKNTLMISGFVLSIMLLIEYLNVLTRGKLDKTIISHKKGQVLFTSFLGVIPGCLGSFATVSLYTHRVISFGAITATMIATSGDEAFIMMSLFPKESFIIFGICFVVAVITGWIIDLFGSHKLANDVHPANYEPVHLNEERCFCFSWQEFINQWKNCSATRTLLCLLLGLFLYGVQTGKIGHSHIVSPNLIAAEQSAIAQHNHEIEHDHTDACNHDAVEHAHNHDCEHDHSEHVHSENCEHGCNEGWAKITLLLAGIIGLLVVISVPDHFLEEHLWKHLVRVHLWRIMLWTFGALLITHILINHLNLQGMIQENHYLVLLIACLLGLIPQSGPHLLFVTLFAQGILPFPILLASCIVQDGHGMIPMLAHSRRDFFQVKLINFVIGLIIGIIGLIFV